MSTTAINLLHLADAASVELTDWRDKATTLTGNQREATHVLYASADGKIETGVWVCTPGRFTSARDGFAETCFFLEGSGTLINDDGSSVELFPGVLVALPDGWRGVWDIRETLKKVYTIAYT